MYSATCAWPGPAEPYTMTRSPVAPALSMRRRARLTSAVRHFPLGSGLTVNGQYGA